MTGIVTGNRRECPSGRGAAPTVSEQEKSLRGGIAHVPGEAAEDSYAQLVAERKQKERIEKARAIVRSCGLKVADTKFGLRVEYFQQRGKSFDELIEAINIVSREDFGREAISGEGFRHDADFGSVPSQDVKHCFFPVLKASESKSLAEQESLLERCGMAVVPRPVIAVAAGLFRLEHGFPVKLEERGTDKDSGDLLQGNVVRTANGVALDSFYFGNVSVRRPIEDGPGVVIAALLPPSRGGLLGRLEKIFQRDS